MYVENYLKTLKPKIEKNTYWIVSDKKKIKKLLKELKHIGVLRLTAITGNDLGRDMEVIYHLIHKEKVINIKILADKKTNRIESVTDIYPGANFMERELHEMFGLDIKGHPNLKLFFLCEESPKTPMRRS